VPQPAPTDGPVWTVVLAAGAGRRYGPQPKQYEVLEDERVLDRSLATARAAADHVVVVLAPGDEDEGVALVESGAADVAVQGGSERADSVRAALAVIDSEAVVIVVHDAARPLASADLHLRVVAAVHAGADAAIPGVPVSDTIKRVTHDPHGEAVVAETVDRAPLVAVQTPQAFRADLLRAAHAGGADATDDAALVEAVGATVVVVPGEATNLKITGPHDLAVATALLRALG
jgi:2-C-methyl-D-erythritol 4-phosphate cytidylyltransferase